MAVELLGTILITEAQAIFAAGDVITSYYNTTTNVFVVQNGEAVITTGDILLISRNGSGDYWTRTDTGFTYVVTDYDGSGNNVTISFVPFGGFPYYSKVVTINPPDPNDGDVNDITLALVSTTKATDTVTNDGEIVVLASGTNTPFLYSIAAIPALDNQSSGTFSNLARGSYTVTSIDSLGYQAQLIVPVDYIPAVHGVRWRVGWQDIAGQEGRLDILERSYVGAVSEVKGASVPFNHSTRGESKDVTDLNIVTSQVDVSLIATTLDEYIEIAEADDDKYKVIVYKDVASSWVETWRGFVNPESFADSPNGVPYNTNFTATDRLADLTSREFVFNDEYVKGSDNNQFVTGDMTHLSALKICLDKTKLANGYRIACNIFDAAHDVATAATLTPLVQTYINTDVYHGDDKVSSCSDVVKDILVIYDAMMVSWAGYWYIIRKKELLTGTKPSIDTNLISYIEYDSDAAYVGAGSWSPRIDFKTTVETSRYRWVGGMSRIMSSVFRKVLLTINTVVNDKGLVQGFSSDNAVYDAYGNLQHMRGFTFWNSQAAEQKLVTFPDENNENEYWEIRYFNRENSDSFIQWNKDIDYSTNDKMVLSVNLRFRANYFTITNPKSFKNYPDYVILKWVVKLGTQYLTTKGGWVSTDPENEAWIEGFQSATKFEQEFTLPDGNSTTETLTVKVFPVNLFERNITATDTTDLIAQIKAVNTLVLDHGSRRLGFIEESVNDIIYYYELIGGGGDDVDNLDSIRPTDYNSSTNSNRWKLVKTYSHIRASTVWSQTSIDYVGLDFLPSGEEIPDEVTSVNTNDILNKVDYSKDINLFDLDSTFNNDEKIFLNYNKLSDGTPTTVWNEVGGTVTQTLQDWLVAWLQRLTKKTRMIISGTFYVDTEFTPINVLNDPTDDNRIFYPNGISSDIRAREYSGEVIEIGSDTAPPSSEFDTSVDQEQHN